MATLKYDLTSNWTVVATSAQQFIAENSSTKLVHLTFSASAPSAAAPYHTLNDGEVITRMGVADSVYVRDGGEGGAFITVSVS